MRALTPWESVPVDWPKNSRGVNSACRRTGRGLATVRIQGIFLLAGLPRQHLSASQSVQPRRRQACPLGRRGPAGGFRLLLFRQWIPGLDGYARMVKHVAQSQNREGRYPRDVVPRCDTSLPKLADRNGPDGWTRRSCRSPSAFSDVIYHHHPHPIIQHPRVHLRGIEPGCA